MIRFSSVFLTVMLTLGCSEKPPEPVQSPVILPVETLTQASRNIASSWDTAGSTDARPALVYWADNRPTLILTCRDISIHIQVRGLEPEQAWPQPTLEVRFGDTVRSKVPDVRNIGNQVAFETSFAIADAVLDRISEGSAIVVSFNNQSATFPAPSAEDRRLFSQRCAHLVPAGMRGAAAT
ncbi:MAG: hypothetical protein JWR59_47 [Brevundimonas sp.]|nr:hypothetical protein [Brevundimonas sp.]